MKNFWVPKITCVVLPLSLCALLAAVPPALSTDQEVSKKTSAGQENTKRNTDSAAKKNKEDQAIDLVWRRPEVKHWLKLFPRGKSKIGGHAAATADHDQGDVYNVHVYEDLPDHTATFGWYNVNVKSGKITRQNPAE